MTCPKLSHAGLIVLVASCLVSCIEANDKKKRLIGATAAGPTNTGTGIVEGVVTMEGDPAAPEPNLQSRIPKDCPDATKTYGLVFREGPGRRVGDAFVGVTGYRGLSTDPGGVVPVTASGCAWNRRTYGLSVKQHLMVRSADDRPYVPSLIGAKSAASLIAVPHGDAVPVFPKGPGLYVLVDEMRNFIQATVLVVNYSTFDVTGLDGKFRIQGVPTGESKISAYLPAANLTVEQKVKVTENTTTRVELKMRFDATAYAAHSAAATPMPASGGFASANTQ